VSDLGQLASALASAARSGPGAPALVGVGWATVDAERTLVGLDGLQVAPETEEPSLGARAWVAWLGATAIVVLEPSTEGRLAAALARRGEGIACLYLAASGPTRSPRLTALGPGRLLPHERPWGPFVLLVDPRSVKEPGARDPSGE
jgi:hypothetical protein